MSYLTLKDITVGKTIYKSCPFYGIEKIKVLSEPYPEGDINNLFFKALIICETGNYEDERSVSDAGIVDNIYNSKRTFDNIEEAENRQRSTKNSTKTLKVN